MVESIGLCQSRCRFVVLMKNKPIKKGFKFYLVRCGITGMCFGIVLHNQLRGTTSPSGFTTDVVKRSVEFKYKHGWENSGYCQLLWQYFFT